MNIFCAFSSVFLTISTIFTGRRFDSVRLGKDHIGYIPDGKVVGLSKLARTVEVFARRAQIQEQLTEQIADAVMQSLQPKGVMVMIEAEHMCMTMRGVQKPGTQTMTYALKGEFEKDKNLAQMFMQMIAG